MQADKLHKIRFIWQMSELHGTHIFTIQIVALCKREVVSATTDEGFYARRL